MRYLAFLFAVVFAFSPAPVRAGSADLTDLFPEQTLVYIEISRPSETFKQLSGFLKGSTLEDALPALNRVREKQSINSFFDSSAAGMVATLLGPEMLQEASRFKGFAAGLTGFNKQREPEWAGVLLPGDSQLPGFLMRGFLSAHPDIRKIAAVEGIDLYQERFVDFVDDPLNGLPVDGGARATRHAGPVFAFQPGMILIASSRDAATQVVLRHKKKDEKAPSLSAHPGLRAASAQRQEPGLFLHADMKAILDRSVIPPLGRNEAEPQTLLLLRKLLPGVQSLTAHLVVQESGINLRGALTIDPMANSPLAALLSGPGLNGSDLRSIGNDSPLTFALKLPAGDRRIASLAGLLDPLVKATGTLGPSASEMLQDLEDRKILERAALAKVTHLSLVLPPLASWPNDRLPLPTILIRAETDESLELIAPAIPAVLALLGGQPADAVTETIDDIRIRSLEGKASPRGLPIHFALHRKTLGIGEDRAFVAACLKREDKDSIGQHPEVISVLKSDDASTGLAIVDWSKWLAPPRADAREPDPRKTAVPQPADFIERGARTNSPPGRTWIPPDLGNHIQGMPPLLVTISRKGDALQLSIHQPDSKALRTKAIDHWFDWFAATGPGGSIRQQQLIDRSGIDVPLVLPPLNAPVP